MNEALLNDTVHGLHDNGAECLPIVADIAASSAAHDIVQQTTRRFSRLDVLVNNAAVSSIQPLLEETENEWGRVFAVKVKARFFLLQAAARVMKESGDGRIVNVSSPAARLTMNNNGSHATAKAAVDYITRTAAASLGMYGITVNAVSPGRMDTPMQRANEEAGPSFRQTYQFSSPSHTLIQLRCALSTGISRAPTEICATIYDLVDGPLPMQGSFEDPESSIKD